MALQIDAVGMIQHPRVRGARAPTIERGALKDVKGIVVHQTDARTAAATFSSYARAGAHGAHFLIDKDGTIYQTASVFKVANHIGPIKPRCLAELTCSPKDFKGIRAGADTHKVEVQKQWPARYPTNQEAVGIEIVGRAELPAGFVPPKQYQNKTPEQLRGEFGIYETPTAAQNGSLKWLIDELIATLKVLPQEVFRHPVVSWKNPDEARRAVWQHD